MKNIIGIFESGADARQAILLLHDQGFKEDDIAFLLHTRQEARSPSGAEDSRTMGRRIGELAADAGASAASFIPFVGRNIVESPMGRALREATQTAGATVGHLLGTLTDGGFTPDQSAGMSRARGQAAVTIRTDDNRAGAAMAILSQAGAIAVEASSSETDAP